MSGRRLAIIGDIHANLPALDAVLDDAARLGITDGVVTGDLVTRGMQPEECVRRVRALRWPTVQGNTDRRAVKAVRGIPTPRALAPGSRAWTHGQLSTAGLAILAGLPTSVRMTVGGVRILVAHGAAGDAVGEISGATPAKLLAAIAARARADVVVTGHTHMPHLIRAGGCDFVNPGSVGESPDRDLFPRWAILHIHDGRATFELRTIASPLASRRNR